MGEHIRHYHIPRVMIAAARSGSGKTTVTCGLLAALKAAGRTPCSFKCGPDYIDPMFHRSVLGISSGNLDAYFADGETLRSLCASEYAEAGADIAVIEGVMGYYDGLGGTTVTGSAYHLALETETPVILVIDAKGASVTLAAEIRGILSYGNETQDRTDCKSAISSGKGSSLRHSGIAGILLNRVSKGFYPRLKKLIERECGVPVVGYLPVMKETLSSRHLGLVQPEELPEIREWVRRISSQIRETVDLEEVQRIAESAPDLCMEGQAAYFAKELHVGRKTTESAADLHTGRQSTNPAGEQPGRGSVPQAHFANDPPVRIAYARDEAFTFSYKENEMLLMRMGAELVYFSPMKDAALPESVSGLILPGGYPELHVKELEANDPMRSLISKAIQSGLPTIAECGGYLYLCDELEGADGYSGKMCGVIRGKGRPAGSLQRFGYFEAETLRDGLFGPKGTRLRGHEFHHWDTEDKGGNPDYCAGELSDFNMNAQRGGLLMKKALSERTERAVFYTNTLAAGFPHFYFAAYPEALAAYIAACRKYRELQ